MYPNYRLPRILAAILILSISALLTSAIPAGAVRYYYQDLGTLPGGNYSFACGINNSGKIVGMAGGSGFDRAFLKNPGQPMEDLGTLRGGNWSVAQGINDSGQVVGLSTGGFIGGSPHAFLKNPGQPMQDLGTLPGGNWSSAYGINASGQIVGRASRAGDGNLYAFLKNPGQPMQDLGALYGGAGSIAHGINAGGQVVGEAQTSFKPHAFLKNPGQPMQDLGTLGGNYSFAYDINASGQVVGMSTDATEHGSAFLKNPGQPMQDLGIPLSEYNQGKSICINDSDQVVGGSQNHAFLWTPSEGMKNLDSLTVNLPSGVMLAKASGINNLGQIVGQTNTSRAFLLTPQVEVAKKIYGIFIGAQQDFPDEDFDFRPDIAAELMAFKFTKLPNYAESLLLTNKMADGGNKKSAIKEAIDYLKTYKLKPGDGLVFFVGCHGGIIGEESSPAGYFLAVGSNIFTRTIEKEAPNLFPDNYITNTDISTMLSGMDNIQKWVFIDACHSGGFYNSIHTLKNACLVASSEADKVSYSRSYDDSGSRGLFSYALDEGFSRKENGKLNVDCNPANGIVTFEEIKDYIVNYNKTNDWRDSIVYELDLGTPAIFTLDKWTPTGTKTADFTGGLSSNHKSISPILLLLMD